MGIAYRNRIFFSSIACATIFLFVDNAIKYTVERNPKETYSCSCETKGMKMLDIRGEKLTLLGIPAIHDAMPKRGLNKI